MQNTQTKSEEIEALIEGIELATQQAKTFLVQGDRVRFNICANDAADNAARLANLSGGRA